MKRFPELITRANLAVIAVTATLGVASPRLTYAVMSKLFGVVLPVDAPPELGAVDVVMALVGLAFAVLFAVDAWRCSQAIDRFLGPAEWTRNHWPHPVTWIPFIVLATPAWLPHVEAAVGPTVRIVAYLLWMFGMLTFLAFVVAGAQIEADAGGEKVRLGLLGVLYHTGGWCGVGVAKQTFAGAKICDKFPTGTPSIAPYILFGLVAWQILSSVAPLTQVGLPVLGVP